jgi:hypothetical protein
MRPELACDLGCWVVYRHPEMTLGPVKILSVRDERMIVMKVTGEACPLPGVFIDSNWEECLAPGASITEEAEAIMRGVRVAAVRDGRRS